MTDPPTNRVVSCPNCGADSPLRNPGIVTLVCGHCHTMLVREDAAFRAGKSSLLAGSRSGIGVGSTGLVVRKRMEVVGRIRCEHPRGAWEEWYLEEADGTAHWLIEEEGQFKLETEVRIQLPTDEITRARAGDTFVIEDKSYQVLETGGAITVGGQGQLPRRFEQGETFQYVDLGVVNGTEILTIEQTADGEILVFKGRSISSSLVELERVDAPVVQEKGGHEECDNCGAALEIPELPEPVQMLTCAYCGGLHRVSGAAATLLSIPARRKDWALPIGAQGVLFGVHYEVIGRMLYRDQEFDEGAWLEPCTTQEILLLGKDDRFATLEFGVDGIALVQKHTEVPPMAEVRTLEWGQSILHGDRTYRMYEGGRSKLLAVDGALPWQAELGDTSRYVDSLDLPSSWARRTRTARRLSVEWTEEESRSEAECFVARHVSVRSIRKAFPDIQLPTPMGKSPLRPNPMQGGPPRFGLVLLIAGIVNLGSSFVMGAATGDNLVDVRVSSEDNGVVGSTTSSTFEIDDDTRFVELNLETNLNNGWLWLDVSVFRTDDGEFIGTTGTEMEYYHGVEGGESWSEGSTHHSRIYKAPEPGSYTMEVSISEGGDQKNFTVKASLDKAQMDVAQPRKFGWLLLALGLLFVLLAAIFNRNPWKED